MYKCKMIEAIESIFCYQYHSQPILVLTNKQSKGEERLICPTCLDNKKDGIQNIQAMTFKNAIKYINDTQDKLQEQKITKIQPILKKIDNYSIKLKEIEQSVQQIISELIKKIQEWKNQLILVRKNYDQYSFIEEIDNIIKSQDEILEEEEQEVEKCIQQLNFDYCEQINVGFKQLIQTVQNSKNKIKLDDQEEKKKIILLQQQNVNTHPEVIKQHPEVIKQHPQVIKQRNLVSFEEISNTDFKQFCCGLAINYLGDLLFTSRETSVVIWKINQKYQLSQQNVQFQQIQNHEKEISSLTSSKKLNWFVTGSHDSKIICWKEMDDKSWINSTHEMHRDGITCLILNQQENQLISSSYDSQILIWKLNCNNNSLEYDYSLQKHKMDVYSISLNQSQSELASLGKDKQIIIWSLNQNNIWQFQQIIENQYEGYRISFFGNNTLIWVQNQFGICKVYEKEQDYYINKPEKDIQLCFKDRIDLENKQASIYNQNRQILIQKHGNLIHFLQKQEDQTLKKACNPIQFDDDFNFCTISNDASLLISWDSKSQKLKCYKLIYE